jgi:HK97 family phage major capsid protein
MSFNLKSYYDAAQSADQRVQAIAGQIDAHFQAGENDKAVGLTASLNEAKAGAKNANDLYLSMRDAAQSQSLGQFTPAGGSAAPAVLKNGRGDTFGQAFRAYLKNGDVGGVRPWMDGGNEIMFRNASNNTDMNIGTAADGGYLDPTTLYQGVIAKRSEMSLPERLGVQRIPGKGTTVNVPYDNEADGEFVDTSEGASFDQDAPAIGQAQMTLVKKSKYITLSHELLEDEDAGLMAFLMNWIARGQAKTMNSMLLTEVGTNGTSYNTTASATAIAAGELEKVALNDTLGDYLDDAGSIGWVMRPSTYAAIQSITGNPRLYAESNNGGAALRPPLLGYPVYYSNKATVIQASAKSAYFGNWNYVGWREAPGFTMLRDPYSAAGTGQVKLWMYFRTVFKVLQPDAVGYLIQHS